MQVYQGQEVHVLREAQEGDVGFVPTASGQVTHDGPATQVLVRLPGGKEQLALRTEVVDGQWHGKPVTVVRDALEGDVGFIMKSASVQQVAGVPGAPISHQSPPPVGHNPRRGDPQYAASHAGQVLIRLRDGTERVVFRSEVQDS